MLKRCVLLVFILALAQACGVRAATPTSTPVPIATEELVPPPTVVPPTVAPTPTHTPVPTALPTPTATADPLRTACDHPYWPLREGATWLHRLAGGRRLQTVTAVSGDMQNAEARLEQVDPDGTRQDVQLLCSAGGIAYGDATVTRPDGRVGTKTLTAREGVSLPPADQLLAGAAWSWTQTADYDFPTYTDGLYSGQSAYTNVASQECQALGVESITVPIGTFDAVKVECTGETVSTTAAGASSTFPFNSTSYYVEGLGSLNVAEDAPVLLSVSIPGGLALVEPLHTACDNTYWPLRKGATWEYTDGSANWTQEVTDVTGDTTHAVATLVTRYASGNSVTFTHDCGEAGSWLAQTAADFGGVQSTTVFTGTGVQMLAGSLLAPGATWHFEGQANLSSSSGQTANNEVFYDYLALPLETKETQAGSFQTLPMLIEFTNAASAAGQPLTTTHWYAPNVGLVFADIGGTTKWDLVSYAIP